MKPEIFARKKTLNCSGKLLNLDKPVVMGILNLSPDSFYDGGKYTQPEIIEKRIDQMIEQGAAIIDLGACSSRPGAGMISADEELKRLKPGFEICLKKTDSVIFSIDTYRAEISRIAVNDYGFSIVNDISGGTIDSQMFETVADLNVPYVLMHMKGTPAEMQKNPEYSNVVEDIIRYFSVKIQELRQLGVHDIILDPGFGFGKTIDHNYQLLAGMDNFRIFELPVLAGLSRKSMIYKYLNCTPQDALNGTAVLNTIALGKGADILRVHDVAEANEAIELFEKTKKYEVRGFL